MKTLSDFDFDGRAVLDFLITASSWASIDQAIASLAIFAHPDVIAAVGNRAIFRTVRGPMADRGKIIDGFMCDDNSSPAIAFAWSVDFKRRPGSDLTCCHLYAASRDPDAYTDLRNIFFAPSFLSKLTDSQAAALPAKHALNTLRYRAFCLYGYSGPGAAAPPAKPFDYDRLDWAEPIGAGVDASVVEDRLRSRLDRKPKDRVTGSVARCGWTFSEYEPDNRVRYSGC